MVILAVHDLARLGHGLWLFAGLKKYSFTRSVYLYFWMFKGKGLLAAASAGLTAGQNAKRQSPAALVA